MAIIEGLETLIKTQEKEREQRFDPNMFLTIKGGDAAKIRFITDGNQVVTVNYHTYQTGRVSRNGKPIFETTYCGWDDNEDCALCARVDKRDSLRLRRMNMFVWVYTLTKADGTVTVINEPRVLRTGGGKSGYITTAFTNYLRKYSTLTDRDYEWRRSGDGQDDTVYSLLPEDKGPAPKELDAAKKGLPDLKDVARGLASIAVERPAAPSTQAVAGEPRKAGPRVTNGKSLLQKLREQKPDESSKEIGDEL